MMAHAALLLRFAPRLLRKRSLGLLTSLETYINDCARVRAAGVVALARDSIAAYKKTLTYPASLLRSFAGLRYVTHSRCEWTYAQKNAGLSKLNPAKHNREATRQKI